MPEEICTIHMYGEVICKKKYYHKKRKFSGIMFMYIMVICFISFLKVLIMYSHHNDMTMSICYERTLISAIEQDVKSEICRYDTVKEQNLIGLQYMY